MTRERLIGLVGSVLARVVFSTLRIRIIDQAGFFNRPPEFPIICAFWHNRIIAVTVAHLRSLSRIRKRVAILTSPSRDGEILAQLLSRFNMSSIRGSSSRRGSRALLECIDWLNAGGDLAVTPDGPKGPRYKLNPGVILLAQKTGAHILPTHARFSNALTLKSWDGFRIPLPFSRVEITMAPYEIIPQTPTEEAFEAERLRIETLLKNEAD